MRVVLSRRRSVVSHAWLAMLVLATTQFSLEHCIAEYVLDDFDVNAVARFGPAIPDSENSATSELTVPFVMTRQLSVVGGLFNTGKADINVSVPSAYHGELRAFTSEFGGGQLVIEYFADTTHGDGIDLSEGGADNALLIDFLAVEGTTRPFSLGCCLKMQTQPEGISRLVLMCQRIPGHSLWHIRLARFFRRTVLDDQICLRFGRLNST